NATGASLPVDAPPPGCDRHRYRTDMSSGRRFPVSVPYTRAPFPASVNTPCTGRFARSYTGRPDLYGKHLRYLRPAACSCSTAHNHHITIPIPAVSFHRGAYAARREFERSFSTLLYLALEIIDVSILLFRHLQKKAFVGHGLNDLFSGRTGKLFIGCQQQVHGVDRLTKDGPERLGELIPTLSAAHVNIGVAFFAAAKHRNKFTVCHCFRSSSISGATGARMASRQPSKNSCPASVPSLRIFSMRFLGARISIGIS